ncbi:hypothetical protein HKH62_04635 [Vibrio cholerae]|uniref:hypothetical protein n=1 Tax=Vibrio cholerae TaxID=666 RepID=UPI001C91948E|nr:hypothetical protein [Vibrio cholerae]MBY3671854.1 hypothetical protein [Vibrio cholerae]
MPDLSIYKVNLDTPQPNGRKGESPRSAFTKYNDLVTQLEGGVVGNFISSTAPAQTYALMEWIDTSTSPATVKRRNSLNTAWVTIGSYEQKIGTAAGANLPSGVTELKNSVGIEAATSSSANKIPQANAAGKIDASWLDWDSAAMALVLASGGRLEVIKDALGNAHLFGVWAIRAYEQLGIPGCPFTGPIDVFRKQDGTFKSECRIAIHKSVNVGGRTVSRAGLAPYVNLNYDEFKAKASGLAGGFVMLDQYHDAFIGWLILSILANGGQQPRGNTEWGRAHDAIHEVGRRVDGKISNERSGNGATLTGSGPDSWRHDGTPFGISDWVGNVWEWVDGFKMIGGQFYIAAYSGQPEAQWIATGRYINSGHVLSMTPPPSPVASNQTWGLLTKASGYVGHELLQKLLIEPIDCTKVLNGRFYYNTDGERLPVRRGNWGDAGSAGPAALNLFYARSNRYSSIGGRLAFVS